MDASISPTKRITSTRKTGNDTFPTTSIIKTADCGHYRFFKYSPHLFKIWKNYEICVFSRHIIDEKLDFVLEFNHPIYSSNILAIRLKIAQRNPRANAFEYLILGRIQVGGRFYMEARLGSLVISNVSHALKLVQLVLLYGLRQLIILDFPHPTWKT